MGSSRSLQLNFLPKSSAFPSSGDLPFVTTDPFPQCHPHYSAAEEQFPQMNVLGVYIDIAHMRMESLLIRHNCR